MTEPASYKSHMLNHCPIYSASKRLKRTISRQKTMLPLNTSSLFRMPTILYRLTRELQTQIPASLLAISRPGIYFYILCSDGMGGGKTGSQDFLQAALHLITRWKDQDLALFVCSSHSCDQAGISWTNELIPIRFGHGSWHKKYRSLSAACPGKQIKKESH